MPLTLGFFPILLPFGRVLVLAVRTLDLTTLLFKVWKIIENKRSIKNPNLGKRAVQTLGVILEEVM